MKNKLFIGSAFFVLAVAILGYVPDTHLKGYLSKHLALEWAVIMFIALVFLKNWWLKGFVLWSLIATVANYNKWSFLTLYTIVLMTVFYQVLCDKLNHKNNIYLLNAICALALIQVGWMILQYCGVWWMFTPRNKIIVPFSNLGYCVGFLANPNHAGAFLALALPAFFRRRWIWFVPPVLTGLAMSRSAGAMIAAMVGAGAFMWFVAPRKRWLFVPLVLLIGIGFVLKFDCSPLRLLSGMKVGRFHAWKSIFGVSYAVGHLKWLIGWGPGQFDISFPRIYQLAIMKNPALERWAWAHNEFVQLWYEQGIIGLGLILGYLGHQFSKFLKTRKTLITLIAFSGVVVAIVNANANFLFHTTTAVIALTYLAILEERINNANTSAS